MSPLSNRAAECKACSAEVGDLSPQTGTGPLSLPDGHDMLQIKDEPAFFFFFSNVSKQRPAPQALPSDDLTAHDNIRSDI